MEETTLVLCLQDQGHFEQVLLGIPQRGPGKGKYNGNGGKIKPSESPEEAAIREFKEESGLVAKIEDLVKVAHLNFYFDRVLKFTCYVYTLREWKGELVDTDEMKGHRWFFTRKLPRQMWDADKEWMKIIFNGFKIVATVKYNFDGSKMISFNFRTVEEF